MFSITTASKAKLLNLIVLSQKNRAPDDDPGAKLAIEIQLPASSMAHFASRMPGIFFEAAKVPPKQGQLEGVAAASETPNLTEFGLKVKRLEWEHEMTGYTLEIVIGTGRKESNIKITDSILSGWRLMPKEGGTVVARFNAESGNVSSEMFGKLAKLKGRDIEITLAPPVVSQQDLDHQQKRDAIPPAPTHKPGAAERAAVAKVKKEPGPKVPHKGDEKPRTTRGKEATKKALEEGAKTAGAAEARKDWPFPGQGAGEGAKADAATKAFVEGSQAKH